MAKPILFIPGFPASELRDRNTLEVVFPPSVGTLLNPERKQRFLERMIDVPGDLIAGPPIRSVLNIAKQAESLYDILAKFGYTIAASGASNDFAPIGWDWRLGVDAQPTMDAIAKAVGEFAPRRIIAVLHSTGVLVFRAFLAQRPELADRFEHVLAFGGAWCGTLEALYAVHEGRSQTLLGFPLINEDESANLIGHAQAAYDLFPPDPARTDMAGVQLVHGSDGQQTSANVDLSWIKEGREQYAIPLAQRANERLGARSRRFELPLTNVVGWGAPTHPTCVLTERDVHFLPEEKHAGDGTVPRVSASWIKGPDVRTITVPIGMFLGDMLPDRHAHLWDSLAVHQVFREVLEGEPRKELVAAAADYDEAIDVNSGAVTIRMTAQAADGSPLPNCVATARIEGKKIAVPFRGGTTAILRLDRQGISSNLSGHLFSFLIDFQWDGGSRKGVAAVFLAP